MIHSSNFWIRHFKESARHQRINWSIGPSITEEERLNILRSMQAWQLGETSEGKHLIAAATKYAKKIRDPHYVQAVQLFIREEQKHGENLGRYIDSIGEQRVKKDWGDTLFRKVRYLNASMEIWTLAVIVVESTAQIFYQALKNATQCQLLKQICTDILIDEAAHITFQTERLAMIYYGKNTFSKSWRRPVYKLFFCGTCGLVWVGHSRLFKAGGISFHEFARKMNHKYHKTIAAITNPVEMAASIA